MYTFIQQLLRHKRKTKRRKNPLHHIERPLLLLTNRKKRIQICEQNKGGWLVKKRRKEKSRYRVKESPHVPVLELAKKGGNLKQTCFERMYKKKSPV